MIRARVNAGIAIILLAGVVEGPPNKRSNDLHINGRLVPANPLDHLGAVLLPIVIGSLNDGRV
jgi:hypothetical protein